MTGVLNNKVLGIKGSMPSGYVLGRTDPGTGQVQMIDLTTLGQRLTNSGGASSSEWNAGNVQYLGANLSITDGTLNASGLSGTAINWTTTTIVASTATFFTTGQPIALSAGLNITVKGTIFVPSSIPSSPGAQIGVVRSDGSAAYVLDIQGVDGDIVIYKVVAGSYFAVVAKNSNNGPVNQWTPFQFNLYVSGSSLNVLGGGVFSAPLESRDSTFDLTSGTWYFCAVSDSLADAGSATYWTGIIP